MESVGDYNEIMSDRNLFNKVVYTPLSLALKILEERRNNSELVKKVEELLNGDIPEVLKNNKCGVQFRQVLTPNNDAINFIKIVDGFGLKPFFMEYHSDKFTSYNDFKVSLGKINLQGSVNKQNSFRVEKIKIIDFNKHNGKPIKDVVTLWDESLIYFHRRLFNQSNISDIKCYNCDMSEWIKKHGVSPVNYYKNFLLMFTCYGIFFENFIVGNKGSEFTKDIILPAIDWVNKETGFKPLIIPIPPMDMENDEYWISYRDDFRDIINNSNK